MSTTFYYPGDVVRVTAAFTLPDGTSADPTQLLAEALAPDNSIIPLTAVFDSTGNYHADLLVLTSGIWKYRWAGTGAAAAALEGFFRVVPTDFPADTFTQSGGSSATSGYDLGNYQIAGYEIAGYNLGG